MSALSASAAEDLRSRYPDVFRQSVWRRWRIPVVAATTILYLCFAWWLFGVGTALSKASWHIAGIYLADWVSYEVRPTVETNGRSLTVAYPRFSPLGDNPNPDWLTKEQETIAAPPRAPAGGAPAPSAPETSTASSAGSFMAPAGPATSAPTTSTQSSADSFMAPAAPASSAPATSTQSSAGSFMAPAAPASSAGSAKGAADAPAPAVPAPPTTETVTTATHLAIGAARVTIAPRTVTVAYEGETRVIDITPGKSVVIRGGPLPAWAKQDGHGGTLRCNFGFRGSIEVRDDEVKVRHRFWGWQNFFFDPQSPFFGKPYGEVLRLIWSDPRLDPAQSNLSLAWNNILNNSEWQHGDVWEKLMQTIVMAFAGTLFASIVAFPLSFVAARNITHNRPVNQVTKRFFDFQRCVDMLIWALFFIRAFGPGPLAGIFAIFFTDTGTLGKLYSEALENIDDKQREGLKSVGAAPVLVQRFGVLPQVLPIFVSQSLYFWESNTRSATIIGAVGAGGIGLKLWEAMRTNANWENVAYMVLLILIVVFIFDGISNAIRSRLIKPQR
ncbi:phosphonate ABC transporter, permease protein PhnE [Jiella sp. M17.18]|uniref:phosphonate ABC transporter, permease protein PhnE n=1 Tax=Jiella sp. M17.18 TaxID=3234247 RepID=UPI0034DECDC7